MLRKKHLFMFVIAAASTMPVLAQKVYRCGNTYSQQPCFDATTVQTEDPRSESQKAQARQAAQRDAKLANDMEKSRLKEEAQAAKLGQIPQPAKPASAKTQARTDEPKTSTDNKKAKKPAYFTAVAPTKPDAASGQKKKSD